MLVTRLTCMWSICILVAAVYLGQPSVQKMTNQDVIKMVPLGLSLG
jgi:hypothetical protein